MLTKEAIDELVRDFVDCDQYEYRVLHNNKIHIVERWFTPYPFYDAPGGSIDSVDFDVDEREYTLTIQEIQRKIEFRIWRHSLIDELDSIKRKHPHFNQQTVLDADFLNKLYKNNLNVYRKLHDGIFKHPYGALWNTYAWDEELPF